jgi:hypothetical protein
MPKLTAKRPDTEIGMRTFLGRSGRTYLVFKERDRPVFHVFAEIQAKEAAEDCGAETSIGNTQTIWDKLWNDAD